MTATIQKECRPVLATSVALACGFAVLMLGRFGSTAQFGLLATIIMVTALFSDLFITPALLLATTFVRAQTIPEVLVTGTVIDDPAVFDQVHREVITAEDIARLSPPTTVDLFRSIPGVDVSQQGGPGGIATVSIRGGDPNFTVVMIDGVKVDDPTNSRGGGYDFAGLDRAGQN